ncbi:hypothetical protein [Fibrobacter sp. UWS1]|uniref:hypothetical protein n=1 Tax=Fibrobacter sp. UWS1 TaxID=1896220 RepID=UPI001179987E|nr:hypothetical protein [Fibrobacter sp. UWS1]
MDFATPNTPPVLQKSTVREDEALVKKKLHLFHGELLLPNENARAKKRAPSKRERPSRNRNTPAKGKKITLYFSPQHRTPVAEPAERVEASFNIIFRKA